MAGITLVAVSGFITAGFGFQGMKAIILHFAADTALLRMSFAIEDPFKGVLNGSGIAANITGCITAVIVCVVGFRGRFRLRCAADLTGINFCAGRGAGGTLGVRAGVPAVGNTAG